MVYKNAKVAGDTAQAYVHCQNTEQVQFANSCYIALYTPIWHDCLMKPLSNYLLTRSTSKRSISHHHHAEVQEVWTCAYTGGL